MVTKYYFTHSNASFKHLNYVNIASIEVVRYEISINFCLVLDFFAKVYKKSQNIRRLAYTTTDGLANVMGL